MTAKNGTYRPCQNCGTPVYVNMCQSSRKKYCSRPCANAAMTNKPNLKKRKPANKMRSHYFKTRRDGKQMNLHRAIMQQQLGRVLLPSEAVHHINGDKFDNRLENLELMPVSDHSRLTNIGRQPSAATRAKQSASQMGKHFGPRRPMSPESNKRRSETMKRVRRERFWSTRKTK